MLVLCRSAQRRLKEVAMISTAERRFLKDSERLQARVEGHLFISVLAYQLLCWARYQLTQSGEVRDWQTQRRLLHAPAA